MPSDNYVSLLQAIAMHPQAFIQPVVDREYSHARLDCPAASALKRFDLLGTLYARTATLICYHHYLL